MNSAREGIMKTEINTDGMRDLWCAVLLQVIADATSDCPYSAEDRRARDEARNMLNFKGRDFRMICELAGLDPVAVGERWDAGLVTRPAMKKTIRDFERRKSA